jgi:hypothetical protein
MADRPTTSDVEITHDMIAAGVAALPFIDPVEIGSMSEETLVCRVYQAMRSRAKTRP